ncbi:response regulator transcription factor [Adlercreutzia sp. ZJ154]|uniref:response regulator transcription factor n=1 Tax=Adlercreutzia sp. ZJ154 TaxID=2709790 RepID=UPI0013EDF87A|nr:response regulator transcription factor [Adlercreutzia sp. ZJ154]
MDDKQIHVLIADDQELVRSGYRAILGTYSDIDVIGAASDGDEAVRMAQLMRPDVVLMDVRMPGKDGISATRDIAHNPLLSGTHILVLTTFDVDRYVYDALEAGASGFLLKDADPDEIVHAIRVVAAGDALIQPSVMRRLVETFAATGKRAVSLGNAESNALLATLTDREREILTLVARGLSNELISKELFISPATVKTHLARIMSKTDSHDRAQLVVFAYESGLVCPGTL